MTAFASADDLRLLDPGVSHERAELVLEIISDGIRNGVRWQVDEHQGTKVVRPEVGYPVRKVFLNGRNISAVTVTLGDSEVLTEEEGYWVDTEAGVVTLTYATCDKITVNYTAGWPPSTRPGIFRLVALEWAVQYAANPTGVKQYSYGRIAVTFSSNDPSTELVIEDRRLDRYSLGPGF